MFMHFIFFNSNNMDGRRINDVTNVTIKPNVIMYPKSITGFMSLKIREAKATIVVKAVYRHGLTI